MTNQRCGFHCYIKITLKFESMLYEAKKCRSSNLDILLSLLCFLENKGCLFPWQIFMQNLPQSSSIKKICCISNSNQHHSKNLTHQKYLLRTACIILPLFLNLSFVQKEENILPTNCPYYAKRKILSGIFIIMRLLR